MENFIFGIHSIALSISNSLVLLTQNHVIWGFTLGIVTSTITHAAIISQHPTEIPRMITRPATDSFQRIAKRAENGTFEVSYTDFLREHARIRIVFYSIFALFLITVGIAMAYPS